MLKNLKAKLKDNKGFSLVELIVVIAIMVILIAMLVPNVVGYINKATLATEKNAASTIFSAAQTYATDMFSKGTPLSGTVEEQDLVDAQLLPKVSGYTPVITLNSANPAIVDSVEFASKTDANVTIKYPEDPTTT